MVPGASGEPASRRLGTPCPWGKPLGLLKELGAGRMGVKGRPCLDQGDGVGWRPGEATAM